MKTIGDLVDYCIKTTKETKNSDVFFRYLGYSQSISVRIYHKGSEHSFYYPHENTPSYCNIDIKNKSKQEINNLVLDIINWIDEEKKDK